MQSKSIAVAEISKGFLSCQAIEDIPSGSFITDLWGPVFDSPTAHTVHIDKEKHVEPRGPMMRFNHSCQPNSKFVYEKRQATFLDLDSNDEVFWYVVATRDIKEGENITFDYNTTEYAMAEVFQCMCGADTCLGEIKGYKYLSPEQQRQRKNDVSPVIRDLSNKCET